MLTQYPNAFYGPIEKESKKTVLHYACEYNSSRSVHMIYDIIFGENEDMLKLSEVYRKSITKEVHIPSKDEFTNI